MAQVWFPKARRDRIRRNFRPAVGEIHILVSTMNKQLRQKYTAMPLRELRRFARDLQRLIAEVESKPRREIDIATEHSGDPTLVDRVSRVEGNTQDQKWYQVERICCSRERCPSCPHGDFRYRYQRSKHGKITKKYVGTMAFDSETIERLMAGVRNPIAVYRIDTSRDADKRQLARR